MKECPRCACCQDDAAENCPNDGTRLEPGFGGSRVLDGKYRLDRRLGEGGMGLVYRALHLGLQRAFAVKLIRPRDRDQPEMLGRFRVEAEALGKLKHADIVDISDFGVDPRTGGLPYLVMEYLEGSSLADYCREMGPLPLDVALPILDSVARAIDFAHDRGVIHRDLKPANVFLCDGTTTGGTAKVLDFGVARLGDPQPEPVGAEDTTVRVNAMSESVESDASPRSPVGSADHSPFSAPRDLTKTGAAIGSVPYMAPEVVEGKGATRASDVYSFGAMAYEMLTGKPPFSGSAREVLLSHLHTAPPAPSTLTVSISVDLDRALLHPLAKPPASRPQRLSEVVEHIREAAHRTELRKWRAREVPRRARLSAFVALVLIGVSIVLWKSAPIEALERVAIDTGFQSLTAHAPDRRLLLVSVDEATLTTQATPLTEKADEFGRDLERVFASGARAIAIDLLLPERWSHSTAFSDLVLQHPETLTLAALSTSAGTTIGPEAVAGLTTSALGPKQASELFALVNLEEDSDGVVRQGRLSYPDQSGGIRQTWAARAVHTLIPNRPAANDLFRVDYSIDANKFQRLSWKDLPWKLDQEPSFFRGRLVLVGGEFEGAGDQAHAVPPRKRTGEISGLSLQALLVNTLLSGTPFRDVPHPPLLVATGIVAGLVFFGVLSRPRPSFPLILGASLIVLLIALNRLLFHIALIVPVAGPVATLLIAALAALVLRRALPALPRREPRAA